MNNLKFFLLFLLLVLLFVLAPVFTILSLNTVFALSIPVTFWTWLSVVWLQAVTFGGVAASIGKK